MWSFCGWRDCFLLPTWPEWLFSSCNCHTQPQPLLSLQVRHDHLAVRFSAVVGSATCPRLLVRQNCSANATKRKSECGPCAGGGTASSSPLGLITVAAAFKLQLPHSNHDIHCHCRFDTITWQFASQSSWDLRHVLVCVWQNYSGHNTKRMSECGSF